jgi:hypothetical protein
MSPTWSSRTNMTPQPRRTWSKLCILDVHPILAVSLFYFTGKQSACILIWLRPFIHLSVHTWKICIMWVQMVQLGPVIIECMNYYPTLVAILQSFFNCGPTMMPLSLKTFSQMTNLAEVLLNRLDSPASLWVDDANEQGITYVKLPPCSHVMAWSDFGLVNGSGPYPGSVYRSKEYILSTWCLRYLDVYLSQWYIFPNFPGCRIYWTNYNWGI